MARRIAFACRVAAMEGSAQEITNVALEPGELSFDAKIAGKAHRIYLRGGEVRPFADPVLPLTLIPAMCEGGSLRVDGDVSPRVLRMQAEFQAIQAVWSRSWPFERAPLREVEVEAGVRAVPEPRRGRVASFFSGGVDSWASILSEPELTDLVFARGLDINPVFSPRHEGLAERVESRLQEVADDLGMPLHVIDTNARQMTEPLIPWDTVAPSMLCAIALFLEPLFERVLIPSDIDHANQVAMGSGRMVDGLWSSEAVEIVDHGSRLSRFERVRLIADDPRVQRSLRVCFMNYDGAYNCGRCRKCAITMIALEALGVRDAFTTFPPELDLAEVEDFTPHVPIQQALWIDCLQGVRSCGREDLARLIEPVVERGAARFADPELLDARGEAAAARAEAAAGQAQLAEVLGSTSWRLTSPLRRFASHARQVARRRTPGGGGRHPG